jgi:hypothetical protein
VANDDSATTTQSAAVTLSVLSNDVNQDNDPLTVTSVTAPGNGAALINANGTITYSPNAAFTGADSFNYTISDGFGGTSTATVTVTVTAAAGVLDIFVHDAGAAIGLAGAEVCLRDGADNLVGCVIANSSGLAQFADITEGVYTIVASAIGHDSERFNITYDITADVAFGGLSDSDPATADAIVALDPAPADWTIEVFVLLDGAPIGGVGVFLYQTTCQGALLAGSNTNSAGTASFSLGAGTYCVSTDPNGDGIPVEDIIELPPGAGLIQITNHEVSI